MKRITEKQSRHSLTTQVVLWVVGFVSMLFVAALFIMFHHARNSIYQEAMEKARQTLRTTELRIDNTLNEVETATRSWHWTIEKRLNRPEIMDSLCQQLLRENPHIQSCTLAFEPGVYPQYGIYYEVYAHRNPADSTQIEVTVNGGKQLYTREKWYFIPLHQEKPIWIDPYIDVEHGETSIITSYGMPLHNKEGELVGVLSAHISMKWFADLVLSLRPFPNSHASVMGTDGRLIIHPDSTLEEHEAFFNKAFNEPTSEGHLAAISMKTGHVGHSEIHMDGKQDFIFYHPFENAGWSVAIVCPESDIFSSYNSLLRYTIIISLSGLLLLALFCFFITHRQLKPLQRLVDEAHRMADGQMDEPVKKSNRTDEVGYVENTFRQMQLSIGQHIAQITHLTDVLSQRNEDLKMAYEQAREADRMKDAVILNMSDRMEQSVKVIHTTIADFRQHATEMNAKEFRQMADKIKEHTDMTTALLDNLLDIADKKERETLMIEMRKNIRQSLSTRLCLDILFIVVLVFSLSLGFLYWQSRNIIREESIDEASHVLDNTALRVKGYMVELETATRNIIWLVNLHNEKDSLLKYTHRIVANHPNTNGCSITMEPDFFPDEEYGFSAYSVRLEDLRSGKDSVVTVREADYDYYDKVWYKTPRQKNTACWVDPFDDYNAGTLSSPEMIASYCIPLNDRQGNFVGVISTDLSLKRLTETITAEHPYQNSYFMLLGADGHYFVHPDTTKLLKQTIFTGVDPREHTDIVALGYEMTNGRTGHMDVKINGTSHIVLYRPLEGTQWSIALVCPSNELLRGYNRLNYILFPLLIIGLLLLAMGCHRIVKHFTQPLGLLAAELRQIGHGDYEKLLPHSQRTDLIGQLQNSFCQMRQSISQHIHEAEKTKLETEQRTKELEQATLLARRASEQKTQFMQDITHQIHTPLNIVHGFSQILCESDMLSDDEKKEMAETMYVQTNALDYMVNKLLTASYVESRQTIITDETVGCNMLAHEAVETASSLVPHTVEMHLDSHVGDELTLQTNRHHLLIVLTELLVNALHFTSQGSITMRIEATDDVVNFIVEDTGPGIPLDKGDFIFEKFTKVDMFTEGLGLGLFLCRRVVMLMGGTLTLDTQYTSGSRFVVSLPLR